MLCQDIVLQLKEASLAWLDIIWYCLINFMSFCQIFIVHITANEHRDKFKKDLLVTTSSGSLFCQKIIHVRARNGFEGWKKTFARSLAEVEKMSLNSVAFPALGTGKYPRNWLEMK